MTLLKILKESSDLDVLVDVPVALMSGRPSAEMTAIKARALTSPSALLDDLGIAMPAKDPDLMIYLEQVYKQMISGAGGKDASKFIRDFFKDPQLVYSPQKKEKGLLITLRSEALKQASRADSTRKILRTYAFWFSSVAVALSSTSGIEVLKEVKFQFAKSANGILIYKNRNPWKNL